MPKSPKSPAASVRESASLIPRSSLQEEIATRLRNEIVEGFWEPGARLQERILCERYGVSRSPLRETFQILVKEGLLELLPGRGAVVTRPTMTDALENIEIIIALEAMSIVLACERAKDEELEEIASLHERMRKCSEEHDVESYYQLNNAVHSAIVHASGNAAMIAAHANVQRHITRLQNLSGALEAITAESLAEHDSFVKALLNRNAKKAEKELRAHLGATAEKIRLRILQS
ncbi:GntR family transcriptional regulator [Woeseia oceani]|uniref:HTH gntR-type domain-containing protein n=1 Tax=Woeseia oceani TaxID=1548547 RepID=A0A193LDB0_9GAMM|nr:GntR family transcriptional regulator [Woeseia oceani]ANO50515.1 hypothetical protein BA177_04180 [Woeseia oceani]